MLTPAAEVVSMADNVVIVGTSMQVYPAASLVGYARPGAQIFYVDPKPSLNYELERVGNLTVIEEPGTTGVRKVLELLGR